MKISTVRYYGGSRDKVCRLGLADLFLELQQIILDTEIEIAEEKQANGAAEVRKAIDCGFAAGTDWVKVASGGVDWSKRRRYNSSILVRIGVEIQVSARSDLLIRDIVHLRNSLQASEIDIGVIVVPSDHFQYFLTDRTPSMKDAIRYIETDLPEASKYPIIVMAIEHDKIGAPLKKMSTNRGKPK